MAPVGLYRAVVLPLVLLCIVASYFYLRVWSSIGTDSTNGTALHSGENLEQEEEQAIYRHQRQNAAQQTEIEVPAKEPFPVSVSGLEHSAELKELDSSSPSIPLDHASFPLDPQRQDFNESMQRSENPIEQQQLGLESFPALISTNNARVAALNLNAFVRFCHRDERDKHLQGQSLIEDPQADLHTSAFAIIPKNSGQRQPLRDKDFETYGEWIDYIKSKNSGQVKDEQEYHSEEHNKSASSSTKSNIRPQFWERPLRGWIVNYTAILEPCDRTKHTSAHCLSYLSQDHLYLIPSSEAKAFPNRAHRMESGASETKIQEGIEPDTDYLEMIEASDVTAAPLLSPPSPSPSPSSSKSTQSSKPPISDVSTLNFHMFWRGYITDKLSLAAHAFLYTQPLDRARLHLWIDSSDLPGMEPEDYEKNPFARDLVSEPLNRYVKLHSWDQVFKNPAYSLPTSDEQEAQQQQQQQQSNRAKVPSVALSDEARFLILYRYGGIYLDADVMLLRDMSPLYDSGMEFAYEWSNTQMYNTAVLRLNRASDVARRILDGAKAKEKEIREKQQSLKQMEDTDTTLLELKTFKTKNRLKKRTRRKAHDSRQFAKREMRPNEIYHPARLRGYLSPQSGGNTLHGNGLVMMPTAIFDPLWLRVDNAESSIGLLDDSERMMEDLRSFPDAFSDPDAVCPAQVNKSHHRGNENEKDFAAGPEVFFTGAYAYHWHNNWRTPIDPDSWIGLMRKAYDGFLAGERPNLYGEWLRDDGQVLFK